MAELNASEKSGKRGSLKRLSPRIDLTAMVDLAFLLITFFMLTTTLSKPHVMGVVMPVKGVPPSASPESRTMTLCLGKNDQVLWYMGMAEKPLTAPAIVNYGKNGLRTTIVNTSKRILAATGKPLIVIIKPSTHALYSNLVSALDELNIASIPSYAIADISPKDIDLLKQQNAF
ncbi:MAG TPA: biopolymer transporter ExbD [Mucilaginibacter sp.]|jgi:biopolymer transport protein ExbD